MGVIAMQAFTALVVVVVVAVVVVPAAAGVFLVFALGVEGQMSLGHRRQLLQLVEPLGARPCCHPPGQGPGIE